MTRTGIVRTVSRGGQVWRMRVTPSPVVFTDARTYVAKIKAQIGKAFPLTWSPTAYGPPYAYASILGYLGSATDTSPGAFTVTIPAGTSVNQITVANSTVPGGGYVLKDGDYFSITESGPKYQVVVMPSTGTSATITTNRPMIEAAGTYSTCYVGLSGQWRFIPVQIPSYSINPAGNQQLLEWDGDFIFYEDLTS